MTWLGDRALGATYDFKFCTVQATGAPTTLAASPVISVYVGNGTTEITAGITLTVDFDGRTGLHNVRVVGTSGNGYATATDNQAVITTGTVNSVSAVGYVVAQWAIENTLTQSTYARIGAPAGASVSADIAAAKADTAAIKTKTDFLPSATAGAAGGVFIAGTNAATTVTTSFTTTFTGNLTGSVGSVTGAVGSVTGAVGSVTAGVTVSTNSDKTGYALTSGERDSVADALLDRTAGVETGQTFRQWLRVAAAALFGKASGLATTTAVYRNTADSKDRITATVDADGNRTAVTLDVT